MTASSLAIFTKAAQMLVEANTIQKAKDLKDLALTAADFAKRKGMGEEAVNYARSYAFEAERKMGEMLIETERAPGKRTDLVTTGDQVEKPTLKDLGLTKKESSKAQKLAAIPVETFEKVVSGEKSRTAALNEIRQEERRDLAVTIPEGQYAVILADPPWQYSNSGFNQSAESQYPTMPVDEICNMKDIVNGFSTPETVLFMWATNPLLPDAFKVMAEWGFEYKTNIAWIKDKGRGKGWFLKSKHELILIGSRNNTPHPKERPDSCFEALRGTIHSKKPKIIYEIISSMYDGNKIEMFCRNPRDGWAAHGNEI